MLRGVRMDLVPMLIIGDAAVRGAGDERPASAAGAPAALPCRAAAQNGRCG